MGVVSGGRRVVGWRAGEGACMLVLEEKALERQARYEAWLRRSGRRGSEVHDTKSWRERVDKRPVTGMGH